MLNAMREHLFGRDARHVGLRVQHAVDAQIGVVADFQVQVGGLAFDRAAQQIVNVQCHQHIPPRESCILTSKLASASQAQQATSGGRVAR